MTGWDEAASRIESWAVICTVFLGDVIWHMVTFDMVAFIGEISGVGLQLHTQAYCQPAFPPALLCLIQTEFSESFRQTLERQQRVRWKDFDQLWRALATGKFLPESVALPGMLIPVAPLLP